MLPASNVKNDSSGWGRSRLHRGIFKICSFTLFEDLLTPIHDWTQIFMRHRNSVQQCWTPSVLRNAKVHCSLSEEQSKHRRIAPVIVPSICFIDRELLRSNIWLKLQGLRAHLLPLLQRLFSLCVLVEFKRTPWKMTTPQRFVCRRGEILKNVTSAKFKGFTS